METYSLPFNSAGNIHSPSAPVLNYALKCKSYRYFTSGWGWYSPSVKGNRIGSHTISRLTVHIVWATKHQSPVLVGAVKPRCRELLIQICDAEDVGILQGVVSKDHVQMHLECPPSLAVSEVVKRMKGQSSRKLQREFPHLEKRYWGRHFWGVGYGAVAMSRKKWCRRIWSITGVA